MNKNILIESIVKNISRTIINEAKSDKLVKQIHRFLVNQFKKRESAVEDFLFTRDGEDIEVSVYFAIEEIEDFNHPFSIEAGSEWDEIDVTIEYRPDAFPKHMNELSSELKETEDIFDKDSVISVMAVDNLPCELPKDSSEDFGSQMLNEIFPLLFNCNDSDVIKGATICDNGILFYIFLFFFEYFFYDIFNVITHHTL